MRAVVQYDSRPAEREYKPFGDGKRSVVYIRKDITEKTVEDAEGAEKTVYECVEYMVNVQTISAEKITEEAIIQAHVDEASSAVRARRNALLAESDSQVLPDRNKSTSTVYKEWAAYRQALRDITTQTGFPFDVEWPAIPA